MCFIGSCMRSVYTLSLLFPTPTTIEREPRSGVDREVQFSSILTRSRIHRFVSKTCSQRNMDVKEKKKANETKSVLRRNKLCMCVDRSEARKISSEHIRGMHIEARRRRKGSRCTRVSRVSRSKWSVVAIN